MTETEAVQILFLEPTTPIKIAWMLLLLSYLAKKISNSRKFFPFFLDYINMVFGVISLLIFTVEIQILWVQIVLISGSTLTIVFWLFGKKLIEKYLEPPLD
jgi:hypothetical protein